MFLHSLRACMMPSISRSWVGYLRSGAENIFEVKATGYQTVSCCCSSNPPEATKEASEKTQKGSENDGSLRTGWKVRSSLSFSRAVLHSFVHMKGTFLVSWDRGEMMVE